MSAWPATKARRVLAALYRIGWTLKRTTSSHRTLARSVTTDPLYARLESILPDPDDVLHVFYAAKQDVRFFATVDQRTILSRTSALEQVVSMRFGTPAQIARYIGITGSTGRT